MTIQEAIVAALDEWASAEDFEFNDQVEFLEQHVTSVVDEWAEAHGYVMLATGVWKKVK